LAFVALALILWRVVSVIEDRARLVRRQADEGEPLVLISRERVAAPLRMFGPVIDAKRGEERAPLLAPTVEAQADTTKRQQAANVVQAQQAGKIAEAKHSPRGGTRVTVLKPSEPSRAAQREYHDPQLPPVEVRDAGALKSLVEDVRRQIESGTIEGELLC